MRSTLRGISIRVKLAVLTAIIVASVVLGQSFQSLVGEAIATQEEIALETRLVLVSMAAVVGNLWSETRIPNLEPLAERFDPSVELRSLAVVSSEGDVLASHGQIPTPQEIRMVTRLRLRTVPRSLWSLGTKPLELTIATPILGQETTRGYLLCTLRSREPVERLRRLATHSALAALFWIALGGGLTLWTTRRITRPLAQLADELLRLGRGSYRIPEEGRADGEIGVVQDRLVELADMLAAERSQVADLTERLNHQIHVISAGLEARAAELSAVLDSVRDGVLLVQRDGRVRRSNEPARALFGHGDDAPLWERVEDSRGLRRALELAHASRSPQLLHTRARGDGGSDRARDLRIRIAPLRTVGNRSDALVVVAEDLSLSRQLTEQMMRSERLASMATLTAGLAHQLGNHLSAIKGYADLLTRGLRGSDERTARDLAAIAREVRAASALLERAQELSRTRRATRLDFTLGEFLRHVKNVADLPASQQGVEIRVSLSNPQVRVRGDPELLGEAVLNIVMNGVQAMPEGGTLRLRGTSRGGWAVIAVEDEGPGIPEAIRGRIFDPFFTTKDSGDGTGLGLAIAQRIVELHGGEISHRSGETGGTTFEVLVPIVDEPAAPGCDAEEADGSTREDSP